MNALHAMMLLNRVEARFKGIVEAIPIDAGIGPDTIIDCYQEAVKLVIQELANEED